jgi:hypothetical protein
VHRGSSLPKHRRRDVSPKNETPTCPDDPTRADVAPPHCVWLPQCWLKVWISRFVCPYLCTSVANLDVSFVGCFSFFSVFGNFTWAVDHRQSLIFGGLHGWIHKLTGFGNRHGETSVVFDLDFSFLNCSEQTSIRIAPPLSFVINQPCNHIGSFKPA